MRYLIPLILAIGVISAEARDLTLDEAYALARKHAYSFKKASADREAAEQALKAATSERFPTLSASANAQYISFVPSLTLQIPGLGVLSRDVGIHDNYQTDLRLALPLFTGGKIAGGIDLARASRDYYESLERADLDRLYFLTRIQYLGLYRSDKSLKAAHAALDRAGVIAGDIQSAFNAGAADSVDLLQARFTVSSAELAVKRAETDRRSSEIQLAVSLGLPVAETLSLTTALSEPALIDMPSAVASDKPELLAADAGVNISRSSLRLARANYFPTLAAFGGFSYGRPNLDRFNNTWNHYFTVGASLTWSFNLAGGSIHKASQARWSFEASRHQRDNIAEQLQQNAELAVEQVRLAYARYVNSRDEYAITSSNYRLAKIKHDDGAMSTNSLLEIEANLTAAEASLSAAEADYHIALSNYYYATGSEKLKEGK